ncbi:MAG: two pore domain potassium channel family protein [Deltaproteobacteria bacterium]|nr:two pore domain potassium channel family protein [Deltaproteobacteria bacterium]
MEVVSLILLVVALLKIVSIVQAIRWLRSWGRCYAGHLHHNPPPDEPAYYAAFEQCGGRHFPFGVKDYRLRRYIGLGRDARGFQRAGVGIASLFQATLYRYERLAGLVGLWAVVMTSVRHDAQLLTSPAVHSTLLYTLTNVVLGTNALLSVEAVFSYAILGGYATSFHMLSPRAGASRLLLELRVAMGRVVTTVFSGAVAAYVAYIAFGALEGKALVARPIQNAWEATQAFLQMLYWAMTTFATVGYGDIIPSNGYGQLVAFLIEVQTFAVLAIVFASLFTSRDTAT